MKKFVGEMVGDGFRKAFDLKHDLDTLDFVFNLRDIDGDNFLLAEVQCVEPNTVLVTFHEPLAKDERIWITMIG